MFATWGRRAGISTTYVGNRDPGAALSLTEQGVGTPGSSSTPRRKGRRVPRYFFNVQGSEFPEEDEDGTVLAGAAEARSALATLAGELLAEADGRFWNGAAWALRVADEQGATVGVLTIEGSSGAG